MNATSPHTSLFAVWRQLAAPARAALQWRLLLLWCVALLLPTAVLALPAWMALGASLDYSVHGAALARALDMTALTDLMAEHGKSAPALHGAAIAAVALGWLLAPLLAGCVVTVARAAEAGPLSIAALLRGAAGHYPRLLRMELWMLAPLGAAIALGAMLRNWAGADAGDALLPSDGRLWRTAAMLVSVLLAALAIVSVEMGRVVLALDQRRRSAVFAWCDGVRLMWRRPLALLGVAAAITVAGLALAALLGAARLHVPPLGVFGFIAAFVLTQLAALALAWMRAARLLALIDVTRTLARR